MQFDEAAAMAGRAAIDASGVDPQRIGMLHLHVGVQAPPRAVGRLCRPPSPRPADRAVSNFDVGNACLGFINGMQIAAAAIDAGQIDYALIVDGEGSRYTQETTIERLQRPDDRSRRRVRRVRLAHPRLRRGGGGHRPDGRAPRRPPPRRRRRPVGHPAQQAVRGRPRPHGDRHPRPARSPGSTSPRRPGRTPATTSTGKSAWTGTSSTRSARSTPA